MGEKRLTVLDKRKLRNLKQYMDLTDDEYDEVMAKKQLDLEPVKEFEDRIKRKIEGFEVDYELSDMKFNDMEQLRALAQALITLEDYEQLSYKMRMEGIENNLTPLDKLNRFMSDMRSDISKLQDDLKISRKIRKSSQEESTIIYLENLQEKAKEFYEQKMFYVFCPKCNMLLTTAWFLYPEYKTNRIQLICHRKLKNGSTCGTKVVVTSKELLDKKSSNLPELMPESMR